MVAMKDMNSFLKDKLKEKGMRVDSFIQKTDVSKSTMYRIMKGYQRPSDEMLDKMSGILKLNVIEKQELKYYSSLVDTDDDVLAAHKAVAKLLLNERDTDPEKIEMVYYDRDKYVRSLDEILQNICELSQEQDFFLKLRIVGCCQEAILNPIHSLALHLTDGGKNFEIEQLLLFSDIDFKENIAVLSGILPLLCLKNYEVKYRESDTEVLVGIIEDLMIAHYSYTDAQGSQVEKELYFTFLPDNLSACYVADSGNMRDFFERSYRSLQQDYKKALNYSKNYETIGGFLIEAELCHDICLFKPNPCYNRVPSQIYHRIAKREPLYEFMRGFLKEEVTKENYDDQVAKLLSYMDARSEASYQNVQVDIVSKAGLESLAATGKLSDPLVGFPAFTKEERREILQYMQKRDLDEHDPYNFYILKEAFGDDQLCIYISSNETMYIEYNIKNTETNYTPCCVIENENLNDIFSSFAQEYVPSILAMPQKDAHAFIDELIARYC